LATPSNCLQAMVVFARALAERNAGKAVSPALLNSACEHTDPFGRKSINFACFPVVPYMVQLLAQPSVPTTLRTDLRQRYLSAALRTSPPPAPAPTGPAPMRTLPDPGGVRVILPAPSSPPPTPVVDEGEAPPPPAPTTGIPTWALVAGGVAVVGVAFMLLK
jgi:hypothetical protein